MIHAARETQQFHGLIIDSSFGSLDRMASKIIEGQAIIPGFFRKLAKDMALFFAQSDLGFNLQQYSPEHAVRLLNLPILFIHGKGDPLIPWTETQQLYVNAREPKQLVFFNTEGHYGTLFDPNYLEIIRKFLQR